MGALLRTKYWTKTAGLLNAGSIWMWSAVGAFFFSIIYKISGSKALSTRDSDFLTAFPNFKISNLFNKPYLFDNSLAEQWMGEKYWQYGPLHQILSLPLYLYSTIDEATAFLFFFLLLMYLGTVLSFYKFTRTVLKIDTQLVLLTLITIISYPFLSALNQRNFEIIEVFLVVSAMYMYSRSNHFAAGALIGAATGIKYLPGILLLPLILERNWKALRGFCLVVIPQLIFVQLYLGWENSFTLKLLTEGEEITIPLRQGLADVILRLTGGSSGGNYNFIFVSLFTLAIAAMILGVHLYHKRQPIQSDRWRVWPILLALICLLSPHSNNYYFVFFVPLIVQTYNFLCNFKLVLDRILFSIGLLLMSLPLPLAVIWRILPSDSVEEWQQFLRNVQSLSPLFFGSLIIVIVALKNRKVLLNLK